MNNTKNALMVSIFAGMGQGKNHYTLASVNKQRELLSTIHKIDIGRRWNFQCLKDLEDQGYIRRKARYKKTSEGQPRRCSSMIVFTIKGLQYLAKKMVQGARRALNNTLRYVTGDDKRWPRLGDVLPANGESINQESWEWLQKTVTETASKFSL